MAERFRKRYLVDKAAVRLETEKVEELEREFDTQLKDIITKRLDATIAYGKEISIEDIASCLMDCFGEQFFDCFISLVQQYSLADVEVLSISGRSKLSTGYNLALFGAPGTGKTFATCDFILGNPKEDLQPCGLPGRNRYCGGMTPAMFIRLGQVYDGKKFNFIIPEFNDWFKYKGMVEPLKLALEHKSVSYETAHEVIRPYKFDSFFSVNYNTKVYEQGYAVTISDPNFDAIEDRMICRLHKLSKQRFLQIASTMFSFLRETGDLTTFAPKIRDHLTLVYAIETRHPLVRERFPFKPVVLTDEVLNTVEKAVKIFLDYLPGDLVSFSPRIIKKTIQLASAMAIPKYFQGADHLIIDKEALKWAIQFFCEEASIRSQEKAKPDEIFGEIVARCNL